MNYDSPATTPVCLLFRQTCNNPHRATAFFELELTPAQFVVSTWSESQQDTLEPVFTTLHPPFPLLWAPNNCCQQRLLHPQRSAGSPLRKGEQFCHEPLLVLGPDHLIPCLAGYPKMSGCTAKRMGLSHPLQVPPLPRCPHTYFYKFTITTLRSKSKIPLKFPHSFMSLKEWLWKANQKWGLTTSKMWVFFFFFLMEKVFLFSQIVLIYCFKQMHHL